MSEQYKLRSDCCIGEKCYCGKDADHKIEEHIFDDTQPRHGYSRYVCDDHFKKVMGLTPYGASFYRDENANQQTLTVLKGDKFLCIKPIWYIGVSSQSMFDRGEEYESMSDGHISDRISIQRPFGTGNFILLYDHFVKLLPSEKFKTMCHEDIR